MSYAQSPSPQRNGTASMYSPDQNVRPQARGRSKSSFSFRSQKSDRSSGSKSKLDMHESEEDKHRSRYQANGVSNPNRAFAEAQPAVRAQQEQATLQPLREVEHKDWQTGAVITDPDASNPSRSRLERPLDTIRSFEAAADHGFMRRNPPTRTESAHAMTGYSTRRSSVVGGYDGAYNPRYAQPNGYDTRRSSMVRSNYDYGRGPPSAYSRRGMGPGMGPRMSSAPLYQRPQSQHGLQPENGPYNNYNYQPSYDTVHTGESSGSQSEPWANSTDPSSENSSNDRLHAYKQADQYGDAYGGSYGRRSASPFQMPIAEETGQGPRNLQGQHPNGYYYQNGSPGQNYPPPQQVQQQPQPNVAMRQPYSQQAHPSESPRNIIRLNGDQSSQQQSGINRQPQQAAYGQQRPQNGQRQPLQPQPQPPASQVDARRGKLGKPRLDKAVPPAPTEKKKGWLKRTFSRT